ncbi:hypothetical protein HZA33_01740 [Candidatus Pacearchaeota archaeon]|nr:hypothetical protein [Candidatus Pacearchaeota archaeon]
MASTDLKNQLIEKSYRNKNSDYVMNAIDDIKKEILGKIYRNNKTGKLYCVAHCSFTKGLERVTLLDIEKLHDCLIYSHSFGKGYHVTGVRAGCSDLYPLDSLYDLHEQVDENSLTEQQREDIKNYIEVIIPEPPKFQEERRSEEGKLS